MKPVKAVEVPRIKGRCAVTPEAPIITPRQVFELRREGSCPHFSATQRILRSRVDKGFVVLGEGCFQENEGPPQTRRRKKSISTIGRPKSYFDKFNARQVQALHCVFDRCDSTKKSGVIDMTFFMKILANATTIDRFLKKVHGFLSRSARQHTTGYKTFSEICFILLPTLSEEEARKIIDAGLKAPPQRHPWGRLQTAAMRAVLVGRGMDCGVGDAGVNDDPTKDISFEKLLELTTLFENMLRMPVAEEDQIDICIPDEVRESWPDDTLRVLTLRRIAQFFGEHEKDEAFYKQFHKVAVGRDTTEPGSVNTINRPGYLDFEGFCEFMIPKKWATKGTDSATQASQPEAETWTQLPDIPSLPTLSLHREPSIQLLERRELQNRELMWSRSDKRRASTPL